MRFHVSGSGARQRSVTAALASLGIAAHDPGTALPSDSIGVWVSLDETLTGVVEAEEALRAGWNVLLRWPGALGVRFAERLVTLADEAGRQVAVIRPLRRVPEFSQIADAGRATILTLAVDLEASARTDAEGILGDLLDACVAVFGESSLQRSEVESALADDGLLGAVAASIRFQNGALAQILLSFGDGAPRFNMVAAGGTGARRAASIVPVPLPVHDAHLASEAAAFTHALSRRTTSGVLLQDSLETLRIAERVRSALRA